MTDDKKNNRNTKLSDAPADNSRRKMVKHLMVGASGITFAKLSPSFAADGDEIPAVISLLLDDSCSVSPELDVPLVFTPQSPNRDQVVCVPPGARFMSLIVRGAGGGSANAAGSDSSGSGMAGGSGARISRDNYDIEGVEKLIVQVGEGGQPDGTPGEFGGGAGGLTAFDDSESFGPVAGAGGGGYSAVLIRGGGANEPVAVAAGGGGSGGSSNLQGSAVGGSGGNATPNGELGDGAGGNGIVGTIGGFGNGGGGAPGAGANLSADSNPGTMGAGFQGGAGGANINTGTFSGGGGGGGGGGIVGGSGGGSGGGFDNEGEFVGGGGGGGGGGGLLGTADEFFNVNTTEGGQGGAAANEGSDGEAGESGTVSITFYERAIPL